MNVNFHISREDWKYIDNIFFPPKSVIIFFTCCYSSFYVSMSNILRKKKEIAGVSRTSLRRNHNAPAKPHCPLCLAVALRRRVVCKARGLHPQAYTKRWYCRRWFICLRSIVTPSKVRQRRLSKRRNVSDCWQDQTIKFYFNFTSFPFFHFHIHSVLFVLS